MGEAGMQAESPVERGQDAPLAIVCGSGSLPFTVADAARRNGRRPVLFALRGFAEPGPLADFDHYWIGLGQLGRFRRMARMEGCADVVMIGGVVRPTLKQLWPDLTAAMLLPKIVTAFRGGDDHLLTRVAAILKDNGFRVIGAHEIAPEILMPAGNLGSRGPSDADRDDIALGLDVLRATSRFDIGQATIVADRRVLAVEGAEGTDRMLAHLAQLRAAGHVRVPSGRGVLVKAAKAGQDRRLDLPSIGPRTLEGAAKAGLSGIAIVSGSAVVAEAERIADLADRLGIFVTGVEDGGGAP